MVTVPNAIVKTYLRMSGRQRKYEDVEKFERHLEECRKVNAVRYSIPEKWDFGKPMEERDYNGHPCFVINSGKGRAVLYLHGGSGIHQMLVYHYRFIRKMVGAEDVTVYLPAYPLAPNYNYRDCYAMLDPLYDDICKDHQIITVMGDSMGGNIALALSEHVERKPESTVLLSPFLDMTIEDPRYEEYYKREPRLSMNELRRCSELWSGGDDRHDPLISPLYGDLSGLNIAVFVGTEEVLLLDSERLRDRVGKEGVSLYYCEYKGMSHVFPLQPIKQANEVFPKIMEHVA